VFGEDNIANLFRLPFHQNAVFVADAVFVVALIHMLIKYCISERDSHPWLLLATALILRSLEVVLIGGNVPPLELVNNCKFFEFQGMSDLVYYSFMTYFSDDLMCGDFVTSGHTFLYLLPLLSALRRKEDKLTLAISVICALVGPIALIVCRYHYFVEILQAILMLLVVDGGITRWRHETGNSFMKTTQTNEK
jgi:hypothetical protein